MLEVEIGGVLSLPLGILNALELHPGRRRNILEIPAEAALVGAAMNTIHPCKDVKVQAAHHIIRVVVVRKCWLPPQCHLSPFSALPLPT
jgi:hypothetical protein